MPVSLTFNGTPYLMPLVGDAGGWGQPVSAWFADVSANALTLSSVAGTGFPGLTVGSGGLTTSGLTTTTTLTVTGSTTLAAATSTGLSFGTVNAATTIDLSKHIALSGTNYGMDVTVNRLNHVVPNGASHKFIVNAIDVATVDSTGLTTTNATMTGNATMASQNTGQLAGFRNQVMNGGFDVWQHGTAITAVNGSWTADRWYTTFDGSGSVTTASQTLLPLTSLYAPMFNAGIANSMVYNISTAGSGGTFRWLAQNIENVRTLSNSSTVTLSFYAWTASGTFVMPFNIFQNFGTGGSPSANVVVAGISTITVTTTPTLYSFTFALPSVLGKAVGSNSNDALTVQIGMPLNQIQAIGLTGIQLEPGPVATPFEQRSRATELTMCQRFFESIATGAFQCLYGGAFATAYGGVCYVYHVAKRATPSFVVPTGWTLSNCATVNLASTVADSCTIYTTATATGNVSFSNNSACGISADL